MLKDSVLSPDGQARWLLYAPAVECDPSSGALEKCWLCRKCREAFAQVKSSTGEPVAMMPAMARANGLWRGPSPAELSALSYAERRVIQLARLYVSVKRVFLGRSSGAVSRDEVPRYHQRNVVAYPQNPDNVWQIIGLMPEGVESIDRDSIRWGASEVRSARSQH